MPRTRPARSSIVHRPGVGDPVAEGPPVPRPAGWNGAGIPVYSTAAVSPWSRASRVREWHTGSTSNRRVPPPARGGSPMRGGCPSCHAYGTGAPAAAAAPPKVTGTSTITRTSTITPTSR
ncbi:hypothetical protein GCM10010240_02710 [Streptomyces griseoviridis]|nr:hypothetical protein GCM10010240_02710 [Streptomyces griseoviridis]